MLTGTPRNYARSGQLRVSAMRHPRAAVPVVIRGQHRTDTQFVLASANLKALAIRGIRGKATMSGDEFHWHLKNHCESSLIAHLRCRKVAAVTRNGPWTCGGSSPLNVNYSRLIVELDPLHL